MLILVLPFLPQKYGQGLRERLRRSGVPSCFCRHRATERADLVAHIAAQVCNHICRRLQLHTLLYDIHIHMALQDQYIFIHMAFSILGPSPLFRQNSTHVLHTVYNLVIKL